ncbi:hypothetical protein G7084_01715 [Weissella coleopterorum]|uniref:Mannosyltransferase related to Gpi18 n=1 Tax=Weissella coleopterorum TaxID=2714949 RepID=A0A6G8AYH9_9LACO|nr:hypothetical protein [Weissella coleopterorum]QIL50151.1 hypothetical protein G7084_01715 [Weissella coleopterorum]
MRINKKMIFGIVTFLWLIVMFAQRNLYPLSPHSDLNAFQIPWWEYLNGHGFHGILNINHDINGNYGPIWYFTIVVLCKLGVYSALPTVWCIKILAGIFTFLSAWAMAVLMRVIIGDKVWNDVLAYTLVLFSPVFLGDIFKTNLPDSSFFLFSILAIVAVFKQKHWLSWFWVGVAVSFKAMGIYVTPFLAFFYLRDFKKMSLWARLSPLMTVIGMAICALPAIILGEHPFMAMFGNIMTRSGGLSKRDFGILKLIDGGSWVWFPNLNHAQKVEMQLAGIAVLALIFLGLYLMIYLIPKLSQQNEALLYLLVASPMLCWLFLPAQHETYFNIAGVFAIILVGVHPNLKHWLILLMTNFLVWSGYHGFRQGVNQVFCTYLLIGLILYLVFEIVRLSNMDVFLANSSNKLGRM